MRSEDPPQTTVKPLPSQRDKHRSSLFLAMYWSGSGIKTVADIIGAYDWVNRLVITRSELEDGLNFLLAADLLERSEVGFKIPDGAYADFAAFLRKRRRNKFDAVELYFRRLDAIDDVPAHVRISERQYEEHLATCRAAVRDASRAGEARSQRLFAYGTLQLEAVQLATFGRRLTGRQDSLPGFELVPLLIEDSAVVEVSGLSHHTMARPTGRAGDVVHGTVLSLTSHEMRGADAYEVKAVKRIEVTLASGKRAWAYVDARSELPDT